MTSRGDGNVYSLIVWISAG